MDRASLYALLLILGASAAASAQDRSDAGQVTEVAVYTDHPRLFLSPSRLRLLRRETERQSLRWEQFQTLIGGKNPLPEAGFALALYYRAGGDKDAGRRAVAWARDPKNGDLRQLALVYDWCQEVMSEQDRQALTARLRKAISGVQEPKNLWRARDLLLAGIAVADEAPAESKAILGVVLRKYWPAEVVRPLSQGKMPFPRSEALALLEILHATRDNLNVDLRQSMPAWFKPLALEWLLSYYPTPWPGRKTSFTYRHPTIR